MQTQMSNVKAANLNMFQNVEGVDKVEVLWLNRVLGTPQIKHPVAQRRAREILDQIRLRTNIHPQISALQRHIKEQTAGLYLLKRQAG